MTAEAPASRASAPQKFALCADDFAISESVSRGVLDLVDAGRLTAVSAMATTPLWAETARELARRRGEVAVGLHLDLTHRPFDGRRRPYDLSRLIVATLSRLADVGAIAAEFERQFDLFEDAFGCRPDHVDGHCHVHALPQIRIAFFNVLTRRFSGLPQELWPLARDPGDAVSRILQRPGARVKALSVAFLSAGFSALAAASGVATNDGFAGFSRFAGAERHGREFEAFFRAPGPRLLVMCHPGLADAAGSRDDPIAAQRGVEYQRLMASELLPRAMLKIGRARDDARGAFADWPPA